MAQLKERVVLGIDPGTVITGYGVVVQSGRKITLIEMGVIKLGKYEDYALRLKKIFEKTLALVEHHKPDELAIEAPFFGKNVQSMLKLGRAQGVAMAAALYRSVPIREYSPKKIKMAITGNGNASKEQVAAMLQTIVGFSETPEFLDATDGLAAAVCHCLQQDQSAPSGKSFGGWKSFLAANPERKL